MDNVDHDVFVYPDAMMCSCGEHESTLTGAAAQRKAYQHARKYLGSSRVTDTRIEFKP